MRAPCVKCGALLHTGEGRVVVSWTADELASAAAALALYPDLRRLADRLLCALGLIDEERSEDLRYVLAIERNGPG